MFHRFNSNNYDICYSINNNNIENCILIERK